MYALYKREIKNFFSSAIGYMVLSVFLIINSLFLWFFDGEFNILNNGYASLENFFWSTPWFFMFIIPAISMGMISEEKKQGTLELLLTHPIKETQLYLAKFLATVTLIILALLPTFIYVYTISQLSLPINNIDLGAITASYFGLIFIVASFSAIGMFSSTISNNQITSFIISSVLSLLIYYSFEYISKIDILSHFSYSIKKIGMVNHFYNISRGVIDFNDFIYFTSITYFFSILTIIRLKFIKFSTSQKKSSYKTLFYITIIVILINYISSFFVYRIDFTADKRFTLNKESINIIQSIENHIYVEVLLTGDLPSGFKQLEGEVIRTLKDFRNYSTYIDYATYNPFESDNLDDRNKKIEELKSEGIQPINLEINKDGEKKSKYIFPWALVKSKGKTIRVNLLKSKIGLSPEQQLNNSIENIEFALIDAIKKIHTAEKPKIAVLKGNKELEDIYISDFLNSQHEYYSFSKITLNNSTSGLELSKVLNKFDALMIIKPSEKFLEKEKLLIDQYIINGGKTLWLLDGVFAEMDSLVNNVKMLVFQRDLNINEMLFKYGFRINSNIVEDLQSSPIKLASGNLGGNVQYHTVPWPYFPLSIPTTKHPIVRNIEAIKLQFASSIDTILNPDLKKTILLESSKYTKTLGVPSIINLLDARENIDENSYLGGKKIFGLLLEGKFTSTFKNRILPFEPENFKEKSKDNKMIVFSDGDIIANQLQNGRALPLGYDKWFNKQYGNKELLENSLSYLLDDTGILNIKNKDFTLRLLNKKLIKKERIYWQVLNIISPLALLILFGSLFLFYRYKKFK